MAGNGANNILKIKTSRFPDYIYNLDPERYKDMKNKILKIRKAKNNKNKKNRTA